MRLVKIEGGRINVFEPQILPTASTLAIGQALKLSGGKLVKCEATDKPVYVALAPANGTSAKPVDVAVGRVEANQVYEVATPGTVAVGTKYTLTSDATGITATATSGVAEVVYTDANSTLVRFS
jgi:hypothetical protein